ncbi:hypothetical protein E2K98_18800 [Bacillus salipaludis]|uniref:Uncharacterized protein n=1 Tax=Bacillus salipaludis TaxID=2547811 RepID=A0A4R5VPB4_9BACI|nr:hypothetical protein [Bacillus salipaludis]MDQ6598336.1 hypothetical protein [Bacillus salipaludis]TDK59300.1 hypothetical protein E2K98_18800 [Bacillus salipaludis]
MAVRGIINLPEVKAQTPTQEAIHLAEVMAARATVPVKIIIMVQMEARVTMILRKSRNIAEVQVTAKIEENSEEVLVR